MNNELSEIVKIMKSVYEKDISKYDDTFLKQATGKRCAATNARKISDYIIYLTNNAAEAQNLFGSLSITYTEFFRNSLTFAHLEQWILPGLFERKSKTNELRIWSAGCSSGQEAYSIAMLAENINAKRPQPFRYRIIATDISEATLAMAKRGEYSQEEIKYIRVKDLSEYFEKSKDMFKVCPGLKEHVSFSAYDLLDNLSSFPQESIFGNFDLVICSNLLFYYKPEYQSSILKKLIDSINEHGYLIMGEAEKHIAMKGNGLSAVAPPSAIFQK